MVSRRDELWVVLCSSGFGRKMKMQALLSHAIAIQCLHFQSELWEWGWGWGG